MNCVNLVGRITKDPDLRHTTSGRGVCQFTIAVNRNFTNQAGQREADFIPVVVWDKQAENFARYMRKGSLISADGRIQTRNYDDKDGKKVYVTEVIAQSIQFLESKQKENYVPQEPDYLNQSSYDVEEIDNIKTDNDPFSNFNEPTQITDDDLPF